ncbi:MAG: GNAT family N-acetyltransferase [Betaproteobacteria bacterium]|nr:GNAT family N-acetyltransferase [Betaproteobacteria bacterium]
MAKGEQTRVLILDQAVALASEVGIEGLTIGALAARLGLSKSGLFAHFGSRESLQLATLKRAQDLFHARVFRPALAAQRGLPRLRALFQNWFEWLDRSPRPGGCVILAATYEFDHRPGPIRDLLLKSQKELRGGIAKAVRMAIDAGHLAAETDPWQLTFELFGIVLAAHHERHMLDDLRAGERGAKAFERLISTCRRQPALTADPKAGDPGFQHDRSLNGKPGFPPLPDRYPAELTASASLGLNHSITIRPIRPEDADLTSEFAANLSVETRYNRFLGGGFALTPEWLRRLTCIDFSRDMALIATVTFGEEETQIGVARYAMLEDGASCEFAAKVADQWHGCGIGEMLMRHLIAPARKAGLKTMIGDVLATNVAMLGLARKLGFAVSAHPEGAELKRVTLDLAAGKEQPSRRETATA